MFIGINCVEVRGHSMTELAYGKEIALGLEGITINASTISDVDGVKGKLVYGGYDIEDLARNSNFEEVTYLLWFGVLPKTDQLKKIQNDLAQERDLPDALIQILKLIPKNANPMRTKYMGYWNTFWQTAWKPSQEWG